MAVARRVIVLDIGTHKAQEVRLLGDYSMGFCLHFLYRLIRSYRGRPEAFRDFSAMQRARKELSKLEFFYCLIEPVIHEEALKPLRTLGDFMFLRGVCSSKPSGPEVLHLASRDLGHSIVPTKPNLSGETLPTWNYNFLDLLEWVNANVRRSDSDMLVLRMNAEGVEKDIIADLARVGREVHRVDAFFGSLGDIKKCFGEAEYQKSVESLRQMAIPFVYFTSSPRSWAEALREFQRIATGNGPTQTVSQETATLAA